MLESASDVRLGLREDPLLTSSFPSSVYSPLLGPNAPRPWIGPRDRRLLVRNLRRQAVGAGLLSSPRIVAECLGIITVCVAHGEPIPPATPDLCFYVWHHCPRERGLRILCSLARIFLWRERVAHNASDVWLLALDLAVPEELVHVEVEELIAALDACPEETIRQVLTARESL